VTQYELAKRIRVPMTRIAEICRRRRAITADTALRLARFFGTTSKFWLGMQEDYDLVIAPLGMSLGGFWLVQRDSSLLVFCGAERMTPSRRSLAPGGDPESRAASSGVERDQRMGFSDSSPASKSR
jgi:addiction module HigA family antidote